MEPSICKTRNISNLLQRILHKNYDFCCLCFDTYRAECINFEDEVVIFGETKQIMELMTSLFGHEFISHISMFETICQTCATNLVNSYTFTEETKSNTQQLINLLDNLYSSCEYTTTQMDKSKSLFLTLNPDLRTSSQYYVDTVIPNSHKAFKIMQEYIDCVKKEKDGEKKSPNKEEVNAKEKSAKVGKEVALKSGDDKPNVTCKECFKEFPTMARLQSHYVRLHAPKRNKCDECSKSFGSLYLLKTHKQDTHVALMCTECGKTFNHRHTLKMHEKSHYLRFICQTCGRFYKNQNTYKKHIDNNICQSETRSSPANAKFTCDYCDKKYSQKITLRVHIQYEHLNYKYHNCTWCPKKFWCKSRLNAHMVKHTKERNFTCSICNNKFVTKEALLYHTRIHTGEKPYKCQHCDTRFLSASRRAVHVKKKHMNPEFECDICHTKFKSNNHLQKHKKLHIADTSEVTVTKPQPKVITGTKITHYIIKDGVFFEDSQNRRQLEVVEDDEYIIKVSENVEV